MNNTKTLLQTSEVVTSNGLLLEMPIKALMSVEADRDAGIAAVDYVCNEDTRYESEKVYDNSDTYIDSEDGNDDDYETCHASWGAHTAYDRDEYDDNFVLTDEDRVSPEATLTDNRSVIQEFCLANEGSPAGHNREVQPQAVVGDSLVWIDWATCIKERKANLPAEIVGCVDWSKVNPQNYLITSDSRLVLID